MQQKHYFVQLQGQTQLQGVILHVNFTPTQGVFIARLTRPVTYKNTRKHKKAPSKEGAESF